MKYIFIAPLIIPKIKKAIGAKELFKFEFFYDRATEKQYLRVEIETGKKEIEGVISIKGLLESKYGRMALNKIETAAPNWATIYGVIDTRKKEIQLIISDYSGAPVLTLKY